MSKPTPLTEMWFLVGDYATNRLRIAEMAVRAQ
jgi:hypothetical protein